MAQLDFTPITNAEMMIDRLEQPDDVTIKFLRDLETGGGLELLLTLTKKDNWSWTAVSNLYINVDFVRFLCRSTAGFEDILAKTEYVAKDGIIYKIVRQYRPQTLDAVWQFKLEPISDFPNAIIP